MSLIYKNADGDSVSVASVAVAGSMRLDEIRKTLESRAMETSSVFQIIFQASVAAGVYSRPGVTAQMTQGEASFVAAVDSMSDDTALSALRDAIAWETAKATIAAILASTDTDEDKLAALAQVAV